jgi:hypothetical protein
MSRRWKIIVPDRLFLLFVLLVRVSAIGLCESGVML